MFKACAKVLCEACVEVFTLCALQDVHVVEHRWRAETKFGAVHYGAARLRPAMRDYDAAVFARLRLAKTGRGGGI